MSFESSMPILKSCKISVNFFLTDLSVCVRWFFSRRIQSLRLDLCSVKVSDSVENVKRFQLFISAKRGLFEALTRGTSQ